MDVLDLINNNHWIYNVLYSLLTIALAVIIYMVFNLLFVKKLEKKSYRIFKSRTLTLMLNYSKASIDIYLL